jgi:2-methylisocitrate lyase-like PEP mutase family enzyme
MSTQGEQTTKFRALHAPGKLLILPNAWDAASARIAQEAGAAAIASSSAAVAWCHGYADGETIPREVVMAATREMLRVVKAPVTVDSEAGYSAEPTDAAGHVMALIDLGVAGINLEDGTDSPDLLAAKIKAIKAAAKATGADIFVNARTDVYLRNLVADDAKLGETIRRGRLYAEAGADGLFVPALNEIGAIGEVAGAIALPFNSLMQKALPPLAELRRAGVRRISTGALIGRASYGVAVRAAKMLLDQGTPDAIFASSGDCPDFNALFA